MKRPEFILKIGFVLVVFVLLYWVESYYEISAFLQPDRISQWLNDAGPMAPLLFIGVMASAVVISPIPSLPLDIAAGTVFGPIAGTLYASIGALLGAMISFLIARFLGRDLIESLISGHINFCTLCSDRLLTKIVFFSRLMPMISFDIVSYGAGLTKMSLVKFSIATYLGMLPLTYLYVTFGAVVVEGGVISLIAGVTVVLLFFLVPRLIEKNDLFSLRKYFQHTDSHHH
ncbi:hypothetical protein DJ030_08400 [bacterium endosymbiont of Escarpia laminata]|nr:MAG: hypothetical protein DJ030_08400 [bacterium endosymbiont of Escarpia laminata]